MYTRRKVFSIANDYDYNDYYERLYSEAFDDGIDYAIEKYFADNKAIGEGTRYLPAIPADENAIRKNNKKQSEKKFYDKMKEKIVNQWNKYSKNEGKGVNWKNIGNRTAMIAAPVAALGALGYGGYKLATRKKEKEKEYSEGFEDGYDFAVQRLFSKYRDNNPLQASVDDAWAQYGKQIKDEAKAQAEAEAAKAAKKAANSMQESIDDAWSDYGKKVNQEDHIKSLRENLHKADANAKYYEDLYKKGQITKSELEKQLASSKSTISGLNTRVDNLQGSLDKAFKGQDRLSKDLRKSESGRKMVEKSLRNWKIGTGIGAGITAAGIGAYALRNRKKNRD